MKTHTRMLIVGALTSAAVLALTGCATTPTRYDSGPIKARTFNYFNARADDASPFTAKEAEIHDLIQQAIERNLAAKGLTKVSKNGDVTVTYLIIVSDGGKTISYADFYGYGQSEDDLQAKAHEAFDIKNKNRTQYNAGTLVIDVADFRKYKLFWRNFVCRPIMNDLPVAERKQRLEDTVNEVLKPLRVAR